ncbi:hypothetical protein GS436_04360 [Rhodococcus hoagii]|uniref:Phage protein n=1 Tax=Rhodococcus hoagii TaxID=43767 RepID=A0AAE2W5L0_RHOHA|nr:hypothetical protein [Prescottella equi]MBM4492806.1 hypothetical protein [Prescottella equi]MBM4713640.1 hypothetical protein [Prescottella equi]NKS11975.1 hypothetical protein [Prescottella equi]
MASSKPGSFQFSSKDAKKIMASRPVQKATERMANVGLAAFRKEASRHARTGQLASRVRREPARGWDGRPGQRIVSYRDGNQPALLGTSRSRPVRAMQAAQRAMAQKRRY